MKNLSFTPANSYLRVATATPEVSIGNVRTNVATITALYMQACTQNSSLVVFPELCLTGYSLGDTVRQQTLLASARAGLLELAKTTTGTNTAMIVGLPFSHNGRLYNAAAMLAGGKVRGIATKTNLPNYSEFYEQRWYQSFAGTTTTEFAGAVIPFGQGLLFTIGGIEVGIEICEDIWVADQPSRKLSAAGALLIVNPSASPELVGKSGYRAELVRMTSAAQRVAYIYSGADWTESTTDIVMGGHALIAENGSTLAERVPFTQEARLLIADVDIDHIRHDRLQDSTKGEEASATVIDCKIKREQTDCLRRTQKSYFLPESESAEQRTARLERIFAIQAHGLARRLLATKSSHIVLGLSGGLDSTLALLVAARAADILQKKPYDFIHALTMPGPASSNRTQNNAVKLAKQLGVRSKTIGITDIANVERQALEHNGEQDITYENIQARARTTLLFNYANKVGGIVLGTGDLSELALGWCTFNGDHMSHYNVNASVPKTLIRDIVSYAANLPVNSAAKAVLNDIVATPISPELTTTTKKGISQQTESLVGPYILHDFFVFHVLRYGDNPAKIAYLANRAFAGVYTQAEVEKWLTVFYERFANNQFKRSVMPDGPKVGSVSLSPRGDWRMPSDMQSALWTDVFAVQ
jgi:NAD+ synthase (glutamine-hydrolysing)